MIYMINLRIVIGFKIHWVYFHMRWPNSIGYNRPDRLTDNRTGRQPVITEPIHNRLRDRKPCRALEDLDLHTTTIASASINFFVPNASVSEAPAPVKPRIRARIPEMRIQVSKRGVQIGENLVGESGLLLRDHVGGGTAMVRCSRVESVNEVECHSLRRITCCSPDNCVAAGDHLLFAEDLGCVGRRSSPAVCRRFRLRWSPVSTCCSPESLAVLVAGDFGCVGCRLPESTTPSSISIVQKWVFKTKRYSNGKVDRYKARLVAKGIGYIKTFSPVSTKDSFRIIMALVAHYNMELHQMNN
ncbi:hypothetical protein OSB04_031892 [Centaurea solstitialis]|uniref:Reverse transcriptase Ty1/copia-type domain-containing protein n=1 Tax=Centaurea solstitialis TaxID=347529 RepID=A0AA38S9W3_9ASTR|nr:hypothetical protein OSB04_031892 [Centaurea solstitialis]